MAVGWLGAAAVFTVPGLSDQARLNLFFLPFIVIIVTIPVLTVIVRRHYRCPGCGAIPRSSRGVLLDPSECPECGTRLK